MSISTTTYLITDLPTEIMTVIFSKLKIKDAVNLGRVNKRLREIYLDLVNKTKYIDCMQPPNRKLTTYIENILQNMRNGNRLVVLKIYPEENSTSLKGILDGKTMEPVTQDDHYPLFKIINLSVIPSSIYALKIHLMNDKNIRIIHFNLYDNVITCDTAKENNDLVLKFIINTPFNSKMRPLKYTFTSNKLKKQ
tara:strand:- start:169 stop:750 length:582 start_codon:yes stop_codon:yes gene_type:complete